MLRKGGREVFRIPEVPFDLQTHRQRRQPTQRLGTHTKPCNSTTDHHPRLPAFTTNNTSQTKNPTHKIQLCVLSADKISLCTSIHPIGKMHTNLSGRMKYVLDQKPQISRSAGTGTRSRRHYPPQREVAPGDAEVLTNPSFVTTSIPRCLLLREKEEAPGVASLAWDSTD